MLLDFVSVCFGVGCVRVCMWGECRACSACGVRVFTQGLCWAVQVALVPAVACACLYVCMCPRACPWGKFVPECAQGCAGAGAAPPERQRQQERHRAAVPAAAPATGSCPQRGERRRGPGPGRVPPERSEGWVRPVPSGGSERLGAERGHRGGGRWSLRRAEPLPFGGRAGRRTERPGSPNGSPRQPCLS